MSYLTEFIKNHTIRKFPRINLFNGANDKYFKETGWYRSFKAKAPVDKHGNPQPWLSIGAIKFLEHRLKEHFTIYEFGSGNSTLYFSQKIAKVVSMEHDKSWYDRISGAMPKNVDLVWSSLDDPDYTDHIKSVNSSFDLIIVDGRKRVECAKSGLSCLTEKGVLIFDDFDREKYQEIRPVMKEHDFKLIEFWGMSPGSSRLKSTAFFYKTENCLDI